MVRMASLAWVGPEHARFSRREVGATACHNSAQAFRIQVSEVLAPWTELPRWCAEVELTAAEQEQLATGSRQFGKENRCSPA
jgi:hypothetical protein